MNGPRRAACGPMAALVMLVAVMPSSAQESQAVALESSPTGGALRLSHPPELDGRVIDDLAWQAALPMTGFRQTTPDEGRPASQRTAVYFGYDDEVLYVGVVCHDEDPGAIIVSDARRDASLDDTDSFRLILDTFRDQQSGMVFGTNPAGLIYDAQVTREGEGTGSVNLNWDATWEVVSRIDEHGWSAEFAIPFKSLRYGPDAVQTWGVNFQRNIRRRNEVAFWAPLPRQFGLNRLSLAGQVDGIEPPPQRSLTVTPYALTTVRRDAEGSSNDSEVGFDLKYTLTPGLALDATYNTDFAQVEVDDLQINLDRFSIFLPEKRPFFLENAGQFAVGVSGELELFFSRRIGIGPDGEVIPIDGGLRLSGKLGAATNVGLLFMQADAVEGIAPGNDFTVARLSRELPNRSSVGALYVERQGDGSLLGESRGDQNRTFAVDGRWGLGDGGLVSGFIARTETPGIDEDDHAFRLRASFDTEAWSAAADYTEVGEGFNPEVGFLRRDSYRKIGASLLRRIRPDDLWGLHELRPHVSYRGFWDFDGFQESGFLHIDNHWEFESAHEFHTGVNFTREGLKEPFEIVDDVFVQPGTYDHGELQLIYFTDQSAPFSFSLRTVVGGFFGGDRVAVRPTLRYRIGESFTSEFSWNRNDIDLPVPNGDFETNLGRLRLSYAFSTRTTLQALVQYSDQDDLLATNLRFSWLRRANSGLYVVYNEIDERAGLAIHGKDRSLTLKYSHIIDVF